MTTGTMGLVRLLDQVPSSSCECVHLHHRPSFSLLTTAGGAEPCNCTDLSFNQDHNLTCVDGVNGTYNAHLFTERAVDIIAQHNPDEPLYIYLAYMNVHEGCSSPLPLQAPLATVQQYGHVELDTYKVSAEVDKRLRALSGPTALFHSANLHLFRFFFRWRLPCTRRWTLVLGR